MVLVGTGAMAVAAKSQELLNQKSAIATSNNTIAAADANQQTDLKSYTALAITGAIAGGFEFGSVIGILVANRGDLKLSLYLSVIAFTMGILNSALTGCAAAGLSRNCATCTQSNQYIAVWAVGRAAGLIADFIYLLATACYIHSTNDPY
ncbi:MAG: hypothetical protein V4534_03320 [Myxococcota bacterium]